MMFRHILVTLDGSTYSERVLSYIPDLAGLAAARVTLLSVMLAPASPLDRERTRSTVPEIDFYRAYLDRHATALREGGIGEVATEVRTGIPARVIAEVARELQVDLIAMSTQGVGAETDVGLGSVASQILMWAPCPLFMVRIDRPKPAGTPAEERWQSEGGANVG